VTSADTRLVVGVDEAGRGAWIGPLVVGAVAVPADGVDRLRDAGARDSKLLSPARREAVYQRIEEIGTTRSIELPPSEIDRHVVHGRLNDLEARTFGQIVREFSPVRAFVDACDTDPRRFGRRVSQEAGPGVRVVSRHHADRLFPLVGAASIVAKVRRDRAMASLGASLGCDVGSGYPSDARTVEFVTAHVRAAAARPAWLRESWATTQRIIPALPTRTLDGFDR
jgi:ribonuclease HII